MDALQMKGAGRDTAAVTVSTCYRIEASDPSPSPSSSRRPKPSPTPATVPALPPKAPPSKGKARQLLPIIGGRYQLLRKLGSGSMGSVWAAEHMTLRSGVAIKLIHPELVGDQEVVQRFLREARAATLVKNPHVVQVLDCGFDDNLPYIALELLRGQSLAARLKKKKVLSIAYTSWVVRQLAQALAPAHKAGVVHRDIKTENVFIAREGERDLVKVLDFGIAKLTGPSLSVDQVNLTKPGFALGTPTSMSPEQVRCASDIDYRSDIWAMGTLAYECLVGAAPFDGDTLTEVLTAIVCGRPPIPSSKGNVPRSFDLWFARACASDRKHRFQSVQEAAKDLSAIADAHLAAKCAVTAEVVAHRRPAPVTPLSAAGNSAIGNGASKRPLTRRLAATASVAVSVACVGAAWCVPAQPLKDRLTVPTSAAVNDPDAFGVEDGSGARGAIWDEELSFFEVPGR